MEWIAFVSKHYINAPAGDESSVLEFLYHIICFCGEKYVTGKGSKFAKGKRYLRQKTGCTGRSIKLMYKTVPNALVKDREDSRFVFRFSIPSYAVIFKHILEVMAENKDVLSDDIAAEVKIIKIEVANPNGTYSELLLRIPLAALDYVVQYGKIEKERRRATEIRDEIRRSDKKY